MELVRELRKMVQRRIWKGGDEGKNGKYRIEKTIMGGVKD